MSQLEFPLYHGTSTLFLGSIARFGLGGHDPVKELHVVECARRLIPLAEPHVDRSPRLKSIWHVFRRMAAQSNEGMNFQHGQSYLSPALSTAVRYAVNKQKGSEIITYTLDVLDELIRLGEGAVKENLCREFPRLFALLDIQAAPVLLRLRGVEEESLLTEKGEAPTTSLKFIREMIANLPEQGTELCQQENFRLTRPVPADSVDAYLIAVSRYHIFSPEYCLFPIVLNPLSAPAS